MKKILLCIALALSASVVMGTCTPNWITTEFGINLSESSVWGDDTFPTCATIRSGELSCCSSAEVGTFQAKADSLVEELETIAAQRDRLIINKRGDVFALKDTLSSIVSSFETLIALPHYQIGSLKVFADMIGVFAQHFSTLQDEFILYQQSRATCFNMLIRAQVTTWCAACMENTFISGMSNVNQFAPGETFSDALYSACKGYLDDALVQNTIIFIDYISASISLLESGLKKQVNEDYGGASEDLNQLLNEYGNIDYPTHIFERPGFPVRYCDPMGCNFMEYLFSSSGLLSKQFAVLGGYDIYLHYPDRRLQDVADGRMLQSFNVHPEIETAGINVNFPLNPGNVDNYPDLEEQENGEENHVENEAGEEDSIDDDNSALRSSFIACSITALITLF